MERLTEKIGNTNCVKGCGSNCKYGFQYCTKEDWENCKTIDDVIDKLAQYEELEEQGRLVKLPCNVGDTVYAIGFNNNKPIIYESVVLRILITEKEIVFNVKVDEFEINSQLKQSMFDRTVFLTKSEAEAKLKELRGGENGSMEQKYSSKM